MAKLLLLVPEKCDDLTFATFENVMNVKSSHFFLKHYLKRKLSSTVSTHCITHHFACITW